MKNIFPNVSPVNFIPNRLDIWKWFFPENRIGETLEINGKKIKKLLHMDINIPDGNFANQINQTGLSGKKRAFAKNYPCVHSCPGCFNNATIKNDIMTWQEVKRVVLEAKELGLESIKFLGPGELTTNPELFDILNFFKNENIVVGMFTKAALMGSDYLAQKYHGISSKEFVDRLTAYDNITFLVGGRSFVPSIENKYIPTKDPSLRGKFNYHKARNLALERLCSAGMNADKGKRRLAIMTNPVSPETIDSVFDIFKWGTERNIPVYVTTTMVSGKGHQMIKSQQEIDFENQYQDLSVSIYNYLLGIRVISKERLLHEGVSPYVGVAPCNQLTHGLYIHYDGEVWRCPGNDTEKFVVHKNVRESNLLDIWINSKNYGINKLNNQCVKDGVTIQSGFYKKVLERVL